MNIAPFNSWFSSFPKDVAKSIYLKSHCLQVLPLGLIFDHFYFNKHFLVIPVLFLYLGDYPIESIIDTIMSIGQTLCF